MAITKNDCTLLFHSKKIGVSFTETLTLGRLNLYVTEADIKDTIRKYNTQTKEIASVNFDSGYSEPLFELLGANNTNSIDFSEYENATIIHDLNIPIADNLKNKFTAIVDGGTIEHVFNFPVAIKNCMDALQIGGHYIGISPANNLMGHGFYQYSPELYYRVFSESNGFRVKQMLVCYTTENGTQWYAVADPAIVNSRVVLMNNFPISLMLIAEKISQKNVFEKTPQQADYTNAWNAFESLKENKIQEKESTAKFYYRKLVPRRLKVILRNLYNIAFEEKNTNSFLGEFNASHFKAVDI